MTLGLYNTLYEACNQAIEKRHIIPQDRGQIKIVSHGCAIITIQKSDSNIGEILERACDKLNNMIGDDLI